MLIESGQVMALEEDCLWVETVQRSTCNSCSAQKGCGQSLLAKWAGRPQYLRVLLSGRSSTDFEVGNSVEIGIPEGVVALGAVFVYLLPLLMMVLGVAAGHLLFISELASVLGALFGVLLGGLLVRYHARCYRNDVRFQAVLLDRIEAVSHI
jgi:sigma-E factor negative regulatory protein RseC